MSTASISHETRPYQMRHRATKNMLDSSFDGLIGSNVVQRW